MGNPVVRNGDFVYGDGSGGTLYDKDGNKYSPPMSSEPYTAEELKAENQDLLKLLPRGSKLLEDGRALLPDGRVMKRRR